MTITLYSMKTRHDMRYQKTKAQINKILSDKTQPLSPHPHPDVNQPPPTHPIPPSFTITIQWTQNYWYK